jgi:hypothetical protein
MRVWSREEQVDNRVRFWELLKTGTSIAAACEMLGVSRRTGRRWILETGGRAPVAKPPQSGRYLSIDERIRIGDLKLAGCSVRSIAAQIERSATNSPPRALPSLSAVRSTTRTIRWARCSSTSSPPSPSSKSTSSACEPAKAWPSPEQKASSRADNRSCRRSSNTNWSGCTTPANTASPASPKSSRSRDRPSTEPSTASQLRARSARLFLW